MAESSTLERVPAAMIEHAARPRASADEGWTVSLLEAPDAAYFLAGQAADVLECLANSISEHDALWPLFNLADGLARDIGAATSLNGYQGASNTASGLLDLMGMLSADKLGDGVFYGAMSLLAMSKQKIDARIDVLSNAKKGSAHA